MEPFKYPHLPVLIVDDETEILEGCEFMLQSGGITNIITCNDSREVLPILEKQNISVLILDLLMPYVTGTELLETISMKWPEIPVFILTGMNDLETAVNCMKQGAFDYMVKPVEEQRMVTGIKRAIERQEERKEYDLFKQLVLNDELKHPEAFTDIVTTSKNIRSIFQYVEAISLTSKPVLITGESGVGKELMARAVHSLSRPEGPFVPVNIAGLDDNLFSDALFGHIKGAFTGAESQRQGLIERAAGGTLFLDEIGDLNPGSQIKLLRLLEEGEYFPVGADVPRESGARIITATNQNLKELRGKEVFRTDLYYRLQTHHIHIPPLRERLDDLPILIHYFLDQAAEDLDKKRPTPPKELYSLLSGYHFPGNVRELQSMIFDAVSHHQSKILSLDRFRVHIENHRSSTIENQRKSMDPPRLFSFFDSLPSLKEVRILLVEEAMDRSGGNISMAANMLGISRSGLSKLLKRSDEDG